MFLSIFVYFMALTLPLLAVGLGHAQKWSYKKRVLTNLIFFFPALFFAILRQNSGTDTLMYRSLYSVRDGQNFLDSISSIDPGFYFFQWIFLYLKIDFQYFLFFQGFFCYLFYSISQPRIDEKIALYGVVVLPVLYVDSIFNGLRYGMGFALAAWIYSRPAPAERKRSFFWVFVPGLFHSSVFLFALQKRIAWIFFSLIVGAGIFYIKDLYVFGYLLNKFISYSDIERNSWFSGLFPLVEIVLFLKIRSVSNAQISTLSRLAVGIISVALIISFFSAASLRFMQIGVFFLGMATSIDAQSNVGNTARAAIWVVGLLTILNLVRQIFFVGPAGDVLFAPYVFSEHLFW